MPVADGFPGAQPAVPLIEVQCAVLSQHPLLSAQACWDVVQPGSRAVTSADDDGAAVATHSPPGAHVFPYGQQALPLSQRKKLVLVHLRGQHTEVVDVTPAAVMVVGHWKKAGSQLESHFDPMRQQRAV
jgi:hypothetical protein